MSGKKAADYLVHAELPGIRKEDLHVNIDGPTVSISAELQRKGRQGRRGVSCGRNDYSAVSRKFRSDRIIDEDKSQRQIQ